MRPRATKRRRKPSSPLFKLMFGTLVGANAALVIFCMYHLALIAASNIDDPIPIVARSTAPVQAKTVFDTAKLTSPLLAVPNGAPNAAPPPTVSPFAPVVPGAVNRNDDRSPVSKLLLSAPRH